MRDQVKRFSEAEMIRLAASGVAKVDLLGRRGTTLCTIDEIEAMAAMIVVAGVLPGNPADPARQPLFVEIEGRVR